MCLPALTGKLGPWILKNTAISTQDPDNATVDDPTEMGKCHGALEEELQLTSAESRKIILSQG